MHVYTPASLFMMSSPSVRAVLTHCLYNMSSSCCFKCLSGECFYYEAHGHRNRNALVPEVIAHEKCMQGGFARHICHNHQSPRCCQINQRKDQAANLFSSLPSFHRADGEAEPGSARDVWNVHFVVQPLVPPGRNRKGGVSITKHQQCNTYLLKGYHGHKYQRIIQNAPEEFSLNCPYH